MSIQIKFSRVDKTYKPNDIVSGVVVVTTAGNSAMSHNGIRLTSLGLMRPHLASRSIGLMESLNAPVKPLEMIKSTMELVPPGKVPAGETEIPFEFDVEPTSSMALVETYHGVYVNVNYGVHVEIQRGAFKKSLQAEAEFFVEVPSKKSYDPSPCTFEMKPEMLANVKKGSVHAIPRFHIRGKLNNPNCKIDEPFTGELKVDESAVVIKSIELQLVRVESVTHSEGNTREATEIQNLQLADGDLPRGLVVPIYMILPRRFTCPSTSNAQFSVEFEVNLIVVFQDNYMVTENFPITLWRDQAREVRPPASIVQVCDRVVAATVTCACCV